MSLFDAWRSGSRDGSADSRSLEPRADDPGSSTDEEERVRAAYDSMRQQVSDEARLETARADRIRIRAQQREVLRRLDASIHYASPGPRLTEEEADELIDEGLRATRAPGISSGGAV
jgi:hypothetical protein